MGTSLIAPTPATQSGGPAPGASAVGLLPAGHTGRESNTPSRSIWSRSSLLAWRHMKPTSPPCWPDFMLPRPAGDLR